MSANLIAETVTDSAAVTSAVTGTARSSDTLRIPLRRILRDFKDARSAELRSDGSLLVTDSESGNLYSFQVDSAAVTPDVLVPGLEVPDGLALVMDTYTAVVSRKSGEIILLDEQWIYMRSVTVPPWAPGASVFHPSDVTANEFGELFILDGRQRRIYHFDANGAFLQHFDLEGTDAPRRLIYYSESLFVTDPNSGQISVFSETGRKLAVIGTFPELTRVRIIQEAVWVLSGDVIHLFSLTGEHLANLKPDLPVGSLTDVAGNSRHVFLLTDRYLYFWRMEN